MRIGGYMNKRIICTCLLAACVAVTLLSGCSTADKKEDSTKPADVLARLVAGNESFVAKRMPHKDLTAGQSPSAVVLACSDSRVAPEILFGHGLGEIFVVRVAGNVSNVENVASIEYAIEHLNSKVIMVMGHESCGAVQSAVKGVPDDQADMKNLAALVENIRENIKSVGGSVEAIPNDPKYRTQAIANVRGVIKDVMDQSSIISRAVKDGTVTMVPAIFSLETGTVEVLSDK
jgi:carbonic anhydrase